MMRPDERANAAEVERDQRFRSNVKRGIGTAASIAGGAASSRILPLLNEYVPIDLALKGLRKVSPPIADFLERGRSAGLDIKEGMNYVKGMMKPEETQQESAPEKKNLIEMHSPELHKFIEQEMKKGRSHLQAGGLATLKFGDVIEKLKKEHKTSWEQILEAVYGGAKPAEQNQPPASQPAAQAPAPVPATQATAQAQPQTGQAQPQQSGQGQQALMGILNKINQKLGQQ